MKRGKTPVDAEAEHLMKSHAMFCLRRAKAFSSLVDDNKAMALHEELQRISSFAREIDGSSGAGVSVDSGTLRHLGLLAINASAAIGVLQMAIANVAKNTKTMVEQKAEP